MAVERCNASVEFDDPAVEGGFLHKTFENAATGGIVHTFGMPLHTEGISHGEGRFDGFDETVGGACHHLQASAVGDGLVMKGVYGYASACHHRRQLAAGDYFHMVCGTVSRRVLTVFQHFRRAASAVFPEPCRHVLRDASACRQGEHLHTTADAEDGDAATECLAEECELVAVALGTDASKFGDGLLATKEGVDVAAAGEQQAVELFYLRQQFFAVVGGREQHGCSAGTTDALPIALGQFGTLGTEIRGDAYNGT